MVSTMKINLLIAASLCCTPLLLAQSGHAATTEQLAPKTTLPIVFTQGFDANHAHTGDVVHARTTQTVSLAFDSVSSNSVTLPLNVYVRAIADPLTSWGATESMGTDDTLATRTQIGGDVLTPSQNEVVSQSGDVVGYNKRNGVYAHLISSVGNSPNGCDASDTEQSMGLYSASACGLYGFTGTTLQQTGRTGEPSTLVLSSNRVAPKVWKNSTALLEVRLTDSTIASR